MKKFVGKEKALFTIAIDGPSGAGKSTVARLVARHLEYVYIDTGAMYRALTLKALQEGIDLKDEKALSRLAAETRIIFDFAGEIGENQRIYCDNEEVTFAIRTPEVSRNVPLVARVPGVRKYMVNMQRQISLNGGVVMDGRDIGSYVLPHADYKFYLTASIKERALRRKVELENKGIFIEFNELEKEMVERDILDMQREVGPLVQVADAVVIDTTQMSIEEVVEKILEIINGGEK